MPVPMDGMWISRMWNPDEFSVICVEASVVGSFFFSSVLLPPPTWENEITLYNIGWIQMENRHFFCESDMQCAAQHVHLFLLPNPLTATKRVGVE